MLNKWTFGKHIVACLGLWILLNVLSTFLLPANKAISIGIIGGIDGPTAYFLSGKLLNAFLQNAVFLLFCAITLLLYKPIKRLIEKA